MDLRETGWEGVDWMHVAQNRGKWRTFVNTVMNLRVPLKAGNILTSLVTTFVFQEGLCSMEFV
jgi:hypothetical protein